MRLRADTKRSHEFEMNRLNVHPCLNDNTEYTSFEPHYAYHPAWAARILAKIKPSKHVDISSVLDFNTIVSAFIPIDFYDYRPAKLILGNLSCKHADLLNLSFASNSIESLSCMHVIEHIGLGRYGDPLDPDGDIKAISELKRVLAIGGHLLFVVPVGKVAQIQFNAHRIYTHEQIKRYFNDLKLIDCAFIPDNAVEVGMIYSDRGMSKASKHSVHGCGCYLFSKQA